ncbi:MAG: precorrin-2 dehydrogenase/sirohydrochlorin ferrochelatase family protein [Sphingobacterium sp.]|uniref:precorrin-2 dehydrogenase/sirohydrochlorin ferrochelatase family protein n=1 Tax=Sphingobacterium sp. JB170 TaxID=1434842 RepID=UPI00097EB890|nr:bifunctional precorrin-2 dehydrogenase/sirohydrochlorin ferrochelatase [Sphingobacterium sp. JB170]SJN36228.1 Siroheme synthase / Precorrin-2 oxidase / Sirohydrochlorin ferrochelatase [Sphingobacterium sp. JB170]
MNELFPIYVKLDSIRVLVVGGGAVGLEKIQAILLNSPGAQVHIVAQHLNEEIPKLVAENMRVTISARAFKENDLEGVDLVFLATNNAELNEQIRQLTRDKNVLLNVADKPSLCDFYLGSVVSKGNLRIGISTNGKSPTIAKRIKEFLNELLPEEIDETLELMGALRNQLKGDFQQKVRALNEHTKDVLSSNSYDNAD